MIRIYGVDEDNPAIEHTFDSIEEFSNLSTEGWNSIYGNDGLKRKKSIITAETDLETEVKDETRVGNPETDKKIAH